MSLLTFRMMCRPRPLVTFIVRPFASAEETKPEEEADKVQLLPRETLSEDYIEKMRNKSKLSQKHYRRFHDLPPELSEDEKIVSSIANLRKMYGKYGSSSSINVGALWPSKEELEVKKEWEKVAYPNSLPEMMDIAKKMVEETEQKTLNRQEELKRKVDKLEDWKREVRGRFAAKEREALVAKEKKERLLEEIRQMFGFRIDPKDVRFKEALEKKELEEKQAAKAAKKLKKQQKIIENIKKMAHQENDKNNETPPSKDSTTLNADPENQSSSAPKS
ncbi:hypothetical protein SK128_003617 [Halocaridina rubra]|uniref:Large ribosomal subunit protein mL64 n=1 Tax=Halocaridina rubra TaxID=373956 RepID=A0AAN8XHU4_HALRR